MSKPPKPSVPYTIRRIPADVDHALRLKAAQSQQIDELTRALIGKPVKADFHDLVGQLQLKRAGRPVPDNHLWIAALAIEHDLALIARDRHFDKLPQLRRAP